MSDVTPGKKNAANAARKTVARKAPQAKKNAVGSLPATPAAKSAKKQGKPLAANAKAKSKATPAAHPVSEPTPAKEKGKPVKEKLKKVKLVRDSFTMPENEYQAIGEIKKACLKAGFAVKKSELLRRGVAQLQKMTSLQLQEALASLPPLKAGRPKKEA